MIDLGLQAALEQTHESAHVLEDAARSGRVLRAHAEALISVPAIGLYGVEGELLAASSDAWALLPTSLAAWEVLDAHRSGRVSGMHISPPIRNAERGDWHLLASRRAADACGEYRDVIVAVLDPRRIAHAHAALDLGPDTTLALLSGESTLLASHPWRDDLIARTFPSLGIGDADGGSPGSACRRASSMGERCCPTARR